MSGTAAGPGLEAVEVDISRDGPSYAKEAEQAVASICIQGTEAALDAVAEADPDLFLHEGRRRIVEAAHRIAERDQVPDLPMVLQNLRHNGDLEEIGGTGFVADVYAFASTDAQLSAYLDELREARARRCIAEAVRDAELEVSEHDSAAAALVEIQGRLRDVQEELPGRVEEGVSDMADVMADPASLQLPEALLPGIALPGYFTLYCGDPKAGGKTSFLTYGAGAVATGRRFLGRPVGPGRVLWVLGEGSEVYIGRYLAQVGHQPDPGTFVTLRSGQDPVGKLERAVEEHEPDLVIIDSLVTWTSALEIDLNSPEVAAPLKRVERLARSGPAVVMIHHGRKSDGDPAGHHSIKAIPDAVRMVEEGETDRERVVKGVGRWGFRTIRYRMETVDDHPDVPDLDYVRFRRVDPGRDMKVRIREYLEDNPGASKSAILEGISGARRAKKVEALEALVEDGIVDPDKSGRAHEYRIAQDPHGHGTATVSDDSGHDGTGTGGDSVAESGPPFLQKGGHSATVAEPVEDEEP